MLCRGASAAEFIVYRGGIYAMLCRIQSSKHALTVEFTGEATHIGLLQCVFAVKLHAPPPPSTVIALTLTTN